MSYTTEEIIGIFEEEGVELTEKHQRSNIHI